MQLRFKSYNNIDQKNREILNIINLPEVEPFFILPEINGLKKNTEDIHLLCIHKKEITQEKYTKNESLIYEKSKSNHKRKIKHIDIKEKGSSSYASAVVDKTYINKKCPSKKWYLIWFHTHNQSISAQSVDDRRASQILYENGIGDTMCSVGINGVTCHFPYSDPPLTATSKWSNTFWKLLKKYNKSTNLIHKIQNMNNNLSIQKEIEAKADQIMCNIDFKNNNTNYICYGKNWDYGIKSFKIGKFDNLYLDGPTDYSKNMIISIPRDRKYECVAIISNNSRKKLICH